MHIVLVHGAGGSAFTWSSVIPLLEAAGHRFSVADNLSQSLDADVADVRSLIDAADDDVLLVGHSYGGAVITNAGRHGRVRGLVYIAAFAPAEGESVQDIVTSYEPAEVSRYMKRGPQGEWMWGDADDARAAVAWDVPDDIWAAERAHNRASADAIFADKTREPAWATTPAWYLIATSDKHLRPEIQRDMAARANATVDEVDTSHAIPHVAPDRVVAFIETAIAELVPA
jgi:pimeloyl-ACP methyl ester carboxylesterase